MDYTLGQELYWEYSEYSHMKGKSEMVRITKIGRRWIGLSNGHRADASTLWADGGKYSSPGRCFLSRDSREEERNRDAAWTALRNKMSFRSPEQVSAADIAQAARLLGV